MKKNSSQSNLQPQGPEGDPRWEPAGEGEELARDPAAISRAFRRSGLVLLLLAAGGVGLAFWLKRAPSRGDARVTELAPPVLPTRPVAEAPRAGFTDVTAAAGLDFVHVNGAMGDKLLPETMGGGVAFFDYDGDADPDLLFVNATYWPWDPRSTNAPAPTQALYRNDGQGRFTNATAVAGLDVSFYGMGAAVGDYDNDGRLDLFFTAVGKNRLFHNEGGGRFVEVTEAAGVGGAPEEWSSSAAWFDLENDGDLDLFVCNYIRWSKAIDLEVGYTIDGTTRAYGQPMNFEGTFSCLYRNEGQGRFTDISEPAGIRVRNPATGAPAAKSLGVAPVDLEGDGRMDLVVANDTVHNFVFHNQGDGTFREIGALAGVAFDSYGNARGAMGIDSGRFRNDASLGIAIGNFANEMTALYVAQNDPLIFTDEAITEGVGPASRLLLKFGVFFFDYDLDGRLDLLTANGHLEEEIRKVQQSQTYAQPAQLFWNCGFENGPCFVALTSEQAGPDLFRPIVGRGSAYADMDGDGDLDVVLAQVGGAPLLLRNDQQLGHRWLRLRLVGTQANRDAIGAWVQIQQGPRLLSRQVMPTRSYLSQSELPVTFGLGSSGSMDRVEILWPDGQRQSLVSPPLDTVTEIRQSPAALHK